VRPLLDCQTAMNEKNNQARELKGGERYWIPKAVIQNHASDIGVMGIAVYNVLSSMVGSNQECFPSQQYIADCLGYSRATINKAIKVLVRHGLIRVEKRNLRHCVYHFLNVRCQAGETEMSTRGNRDVPPVDTNKNQLTRINNNTVRLKKILSPDTRNTGPASGYEGRTSRVRHSDRLGRLPKPTPVSLFGRKIPGAFAPADVKREQGDTESRNQKEPSRPL